jgi:hypothetical protein
MHSHFRNLPNDDGIVIWEEGLLPRCETCAIFQRNVGTNTSSKKGVAIYHG